MAEVVHVRYGSGGTLGISRDEGSGAWQASPSGAVPPEALRLARRIASGYVYEVYHGYPGDYLAGQIAHATGGKALIPVREPLPPGTVS